MTRAGLAARASNDSDLDLDSAVRCWQGPLAVTVTGMPVVRLMMTGAK